jgi:hypothetical protein
VLVKLENWTKFCRSRTFFLGQPGICRDAGSGVLEGRGSQPTNGTQRERGSELQGFVMGSSLVVEMARKGPGVAKIS